MRKGVLTKKKGKRRNFMREKRRMGRGRGRGESKLGLLREGEN